MAMSRHFWTDAQAATYKTNYQTKTYKQLTDIINEKHNLNLTLNQVRHFGRKNGMTTRFNPKPFKKGNTLWRGGINTQFKKGHTYKEYPLGTEKVNAEGYTLVKVSMTGTQREKWKFKHRLVWEREHGPIPESHILIFLDGNKQNISLDNLKLITRQVNAIMNIRKWHTENKEETKVRILQAQLMSVRNQKEMKL